MPRRPISSGDDPGAIYLIIALGKVTVDLDVRDMVADQSSITIAPSSITIVLSLLAPSLVAIFTLFGELPSSTSENGLLVPLIAEEVPLVILAAAVS